MSRQQKGQKRKDHSGPALEPRHFLNVVNGYANTNRDSGKRTTFEHVVDVALKAGLVRKHDLTATFGINAKDVKATPTETRARFIDEVTSRIEQEPAL